MLMTAAAAPAEFDGAAIVFDLDGTLVDTAPDLVRALNHTLDLEGLPHVSATAVRRIIGHGARAMIERGAALADARFSETRLDALTHEFVAFYRENIAVESAPFPGAVETLAAFSEAGATLAVCTNKRTALSVQLLEALNLAERFAAIVGADAVAERKPHPGHLIETVARANGEITRALMVGDSTTDVGAARGARVPVVVVSFGYPDASPAALGGDAVIDHFSELAHAARLLLAPRG